MAIDDALLQRIGEGTSPPTLRFYSWTGPWVSLGSGQSAADLDLVAIRDRDWGVVRRASGGTAVLHQGQLGYALILPTSHSTWHGDLIASYQRLSQPFRRAFDRLGAVTIAEPPGANANFVLDAPSAASRVCFGALGPYELSYAGRKLIGNSQVRRRHASAQHGVIQIDRSQVSIADAIETETEAEREALVDYLDSRVTSLSVATRRIINLSEVETTLIDAFESDLDLPLHNGELSTDEHELANELAGTKYSNDTWTFRR